MRFLTPIAFRSPLLALALTAGLLNGCISYAPRVLVPALTLSAEDVSLRSSAAGSDQSSFGLDVTVNESDSLVNVQTLPGIRVRTVNPGGPADAAGIQPGDIVLAIDDIPTDHPDTLAVIRRQAAGGAHRFTVRRNTTVFDANVMATVMSAGAAPQELYRADPIATRAGYRTELVNISGQTAVAAARVVQLFPDSPLPAAGINSGDLVLALNGSNLNSAQDLINRLNRDFALGEKVVLTVFSGDGVTNRELTNKTVTLWDPGRRISRISLWPVLQYESSLSPSSDSLTILDLWLFAAYRYTRVDGEKSHNILGLLKFSSNYGELTEEAN